MYFGKLSLRLFGIGSSNTIAVVYVRLPKWSVVVKLKHLGISGFSACTCRPFGKQNIDTLSLNLKLGQSTEGYRARTCGVNLIFLLSVRIRVKDRFFMEPN